MVDLKHVGSATETHMLSAWDVVQLARHPERPHGSSYLKTFMDFDQLHGDRMYGDCQSIIAGTAMFDNRAVMLLAQEKGSDLESRIQHNFGMPMPEGYRKAARMYRLAERYRMPVVIFLDSPGAYAGVDAENRNQSQAIADNILLMTGLKVPIVVFVIGEAMSGGAMAMGVSDYTVMLSNSIYSVISPEGCSGILWKDKQHMADASEQMSITAPDLLKRGFIDEIIEEPSGGCHHDPEKVILSIHEVLKIQLDRLTSLSEKDLLKQRESRLLKS
ncbi:MAG: carboxyltransferase subunit alpha [Pseudomonadota bacterium]|nr:carboxyltransferase subunit alpha [Pseudomonadota bacterium]